MFEVASDEVRDGDQRTGGPVSTSLGLGSLNKRVDTFSSTIADSGIEGCQDASQVFVQGQSETFEWFQA